MEGKTYKRTFSNMEGAIKFSSELRQQGRELINRYVVVEYR